MKDRRGFLKLLGIGAGAAVAMVAARIASTPAPAPRPIQDIERPVKPYIGPDSPEDYIKERPKVIPNIPIPPEGSIERPFVINAVDPHIKLHTITTRYIWPDNTRNLRTLTNACDYNLGYSVTVDNEFSS